MTLTRRPSPLGEIETLRQAMDRLVDDTVFRPSSSGSGLADAGRLARDVEITVEDRTLTIKAEA